uniref:DM2 domain-containing protein n=1 Tax=viral metagenome TaxID=1070528 RepID=A0A6C0H6L7_9ZZZZ
MSTKTTSTKPKATKSKAAKVAEPVPEPEPVVEAPAIVEAPSVVEAAAETVVVENTEVASMRQRFEALIKSRQDQIADLKQEIQEIRKMQRDHEHAIKDASKKSKKKKVPRDDANPRKPSGFASPVVVSDELYSFLERYSVKKGEPIARTDVTRHITNYIKEHDLQNPEHRREILPDAALKKLFSEPIEPKDPANPDGPKMWSYLKMQRYISHHFPKKQQ